MLLRGNTLARIASGEITLAFRRWRRPTVRSGGTLLTAAGQLEIQAVSVVPIDAITPDEASHAGYASYEALAADLDRRNGGEVYRIEFGALRPDPRVALRESPLDEQAAADLQARLTRLDAASPDGAWTVKTLQAVRDHPGVRAGELCRLVDQERDRFKPNVRKLKNLGLTISLEVGYRLSPRGEAYLHQHRIMSFVLTESMAVLERTPEAFRALLSGLSDTWTRTDEGPDTFTPFDNLGHLVHGERTDWIPRARIILAATGDRRFAPFDRFAHIREGEGKQLSDLLDEFTRLRGENLATLRGWSLSDADLALEGEHPELGTVTLGQLLATWVAHDLGHLAQTSRVMAKRYREAVGPWRAYLPVLDR